MFSEFHGEMLLPWSTLSNQYKVTEYKGGEKYAEAVHRWYFQHTDSIDINNRKSRDNSKMSRKWWILSITFVFFTFVFNIIYLI